MRAYIRPHDSQEEAPKDLAGIRQRGSTYQAPISGGTNPVIGQQSFLSGSADTEDVVIVLGGRGDA